MKQRLYEGKRAAVEYRPQGGALYGYLKLNGVKGTEFFSEYDPAPLPAKEYFMRWMGKALARKILGGDFKIKRAEFVVVEKENRGILDFRLREVDMLSALLAAERVRKAEEETEDEEGAARLIDEAFQMMKRKGGRR